jgi:hypothetical protein
VSSCDIRSEPNRRRWPHCLASAYIPYYVGVSREDPPPPEPQGNLHRIDIEPARIKNEDHWMVSLRFFAHSGYENHGMPIYKTIVGKRPS